MKRNQFEFNPAAGLQIVTKSRIALSLLFAFFTLSMLLTWRLSIQLSTNVCLGPPYLYVTVHDGRNIYKFSRDGCSLSQKVLWHGSKQVRELRGMFIYNNDKEEVLYVADSSDSTYGLNSQILQYGTCSKWSNLRPYLSTVMQNSDAHSGGVHAYAISIDKMGNIYSSFQHTDAVLRYSSTDHKPIPFPMSITNPLTKGKGKFLNSAINIFNSSASTVQYFEGTFAQFGSPTIHNDTERGLRGITWVSNGDEGLNELWIANEDYNRIFIVDSEAHEIASLHITKPIALHFDTSRGVVYVGSKSKKEQGAGSVFAVDVKTRQVTSTFNLLGSLTHPTGITTFEDVLFVGEQSKNVVVTFNINTTRFMRQIISRFPSPVEDLVLSSC